jgi:hypothetical protein
MNDLDVFGLDRDVRRAAAQERAWRRRLRADAESAADEPWFEPVRHVTTRATFEAVSELPAGDPFREPLRRWIYRLAMTRIAQPLLARAALARQAKHANLALPDRGAHSVGDLVHRLLAEREPGRRALWLDGLLEVAPPVVDAERHLREGEIEIGARLGAGDGAAFWSCEPEILRQTASELLAKTDDLASSLLAPLGEFSNLVGTVVARDVPGVWPGGSMFRWTVDMFRATPLLDGITLDLGPAPPALGASSFVRAFARFGAAYARAAPATGPTFAHAHDPLEIGALRRGALFGALFAEPAFLRQRVELSPEAARGAARDMGRTLLASVRLDAVRALADLPMLGPSEAAERVHQALPVNVPPGLAGVLPRAAPRAPFTFLAALLARADAEALRDRFDEDWFRNPEALRHLRQTDAAPFDPKLPKDALAGAATRIAAWLESLGG